MVCRPVMNKITAAEKAVRIEKAAQSAIPFIRFLLKAFCNTVFIRPTTMDMDKIQ